MNEVSQNERVELTAEQQLAENNARLINETRERKTAQSKVENLEGALRLINAKTEQLEANITVLREQRDRFLETESDASVNLYLEKAQAARQINNIEKQAQAILNEAQPLRAQLNQAHADLTEVRTKFGATKSAQKKAEAQTERSERNTNQVRAALDWYVTVTSGVRYSVPSRFFKATNIELSHEHIEIAYNHLEGTRFQITAENLVEYLVDSTK